MKKIINLRRKLSFGFPRASLAVGLRLVFFSSCLAFNFIFITSLDTIRITIQGLEISNFHLSDFVLRFVDFVFIIHIFTCNPSTVRSSLESWILET